MSKKTLYLIASLAVILALTLILGGKQTKDNSQAAVSAQPVNGVVGNTITQAIENAQKVPAPAIVSQPTDEQAVDINLPPNAATEAMGNGNVAAPTPAQAPSPTEGQ